MVKNLGFKDFLTVDYAPGMPDQIKKNAKKRKMADVAGSNAEYSSTHAPGEHVDTVTEATPPGGAPIAALTPKQAHNWLDQGKHAKKLDMGWPTKNVTVKQKGASSKEKHHVHVHQYMESAVEEAVEEAALNPTQRRARALQMRKNKSKISLGRKRTERTFANPERIMKRARRQARTMLFKKLTKGINKSELNFSRRQDIEKRLNTPAMKKVIERIARKLIPKERQQEIQRHKGSSNSDD